MRTTQTSALATVLCVACATLLAATTDTQQATPTRSGRTPAVTMSYRGAEWLERVERIAEEEPEKVIEILDLAPGDVVADVGCATGYFARRIAPLVGPSGTVYCVDIQPEMLDMMASIAAREGIEGIERVLSTQDDLKLPRDAIDWIVLADVYHEMSDPQPMLAGMRDALAPGGRVALLEYRLEDASGDLIKADHRMSARQVMIEWGEAGFELEALHEFLPAQHLFVFRAAGEDADDSRPAARAVQMRDLLEAVADGSVRVEVRVKDAGAVTLRVGEATRYPVLLTVATGTSFVPEDASHELIARRDGVVLVPDDGWYEADVRMLARSRTRPDLQTGTPLTMRPPQLERRLATLIDTLQAGTYIRPGRAQPLLYPPQTLDVERTAVWIADENPTFDQIAPFVGDDQMSAQYVVAFALVFCDQAGIDITATQLWTNHTELFTGLRYPPLRVWYEDKLEQWTIRAEP